MPNPRDLIDKVERASKLLGVDIDWLAKIYGWAFIGEALWWA